MANFITINNRTIHYRLSADNGSQTLAFINSLGTDFRIWDQVISHLPRNINVLCHDKSGHGLSDLGATSIEDYASDLSGLISALNLSNIVLCGVSVGGLIAQELALSGKPNVKGMILSNTGYKIGTDQAWAERIQAIESTGLEPMADGILERWFSPQFRENCAERTAGYRNMLTRTPKTGYLDTCRALRDADLGGRISAITCPTLCLAGSVDFATPPELVRDLSQSISSAQFKLYDGVGHLPSIEVPQEVANDISEFLKHLP